jgi:hypothetical protein
MMYFFPENFGNGIWADVLNSPKVAFLFAFLFLVNFTSSKAFAGPLDTLQPGHWYEVPNSKIRPHLPSPLPYGSPAAIMNAWSGGFFDSARNRYVVMGGGHGDYAGNEMYVFNLDTLQWSRLWGPTPNSQIPPIGSAVVEVYADGKPSSRHTYSGIQYLPNVDKYFVHGGSLWSGSGGMGKTTWFFDPALSTWTQRADISSGCYGGGAVPFTAYDPNTGNVYAHKYTSLCEYNPLTNTWRKRGGDSKGASPRATSVFDPKRKQFCLIGGGSTQCYDMASTASSIPLQTIATTGDKTAESVSYVGVDYDRISEKIVAWAGGADVYTLDLTTRVWTKLPASASNTVTPTAPTHTGSHSRWRYIPSKNVFIIVNSIDQNVYVYKLSSGSGTPPPPIMTTPNMPTNLRLAGVTTSPPPPPSDSTLPSIPAGLTAQAVSSSQINLSWTASTDDVGVTGYKVFRNSAQIATVATTSYQNTGLLSSTTYSFTVAALDAKGNESAQSTRVSATTQSGTTPPPPPGGQIALPLRTWVKQPANQTLYRIGGGNKHTSVSFNSDDGLIYLFGGDHNGSNPPDPTLLSSPHQSGRNEAYTYEVATNTVKQVQQYCQPGVIGNGLDEVGWAYDSKRKIFWMFPGFQWDQSAFCPSTTQMVRGQIMTYNPASRTWTVPAIPQAPSGTTGNFTQYDPVTDTFIRFVKSGGGGPRAMIYAPTTNTWQQVDSPIKDNESYHDLGTTIDVVGRKMYVISKTGLIQYDIDAKTFANLGPVPDLFYVENKPVWDSVNRVLLWPVFGDLDCPDAAAGCQEQLRLHAYSPATKTWETNIASSQLPDGTLVKGRHAIFDPKQNVLVAWGNVWNRPNGGGFFLFRYGKGR